MPIDRRSSRLATWMILVAWLFALGAGVANACLLSDPGHGSHSPSEASPPHVSVAEAHRDAPTDFGKAGCLKFCDEAPLAITKADQPLTVGSSGWVGVLHRTSGPTLASAAALQRRVHATRPAHMALPIDARPHRLTL